MNHEERRRRQQLERLERQQRIIEMHMERQAQQIERRREEIERRFARARQHLGMDATEPSDDQRRIVAAALELLDEVGLNDLSLRKLAAKLDLKAPALYWHFKNKEALIDYMAEAILSEEFAELAPRAEEESWQDWLITMCQRLRRAMLAHRDGARIVAGAHLYPAVTLMRLFEVSMQSLTSAGVKLDRANLIVSTSVHFVFGNVIEQQASPSLDEIQDFNAQTIATDFPLMARSIELAVEAMRVGHDEFEDSLRLIIGEDH